jgi:hypothetical protein
MHAFIKISSISCVFMFGCSLAIAQTVNTTTDWIEAKTSRSLPGQEEMVGKTFFSPVFVKTSGEFRAMYDSVLDKRKTIKGDFIVGKFRYKYRTPIGSQQSRIDPLHDEFIAEIILDCKQHFSGIKNSTLSLNGKVVLQSEDSDVLLTQEYAKGTTVADLCDFAKVQNAW